MKKSKSSQSFRNKLKTLYFGQAFPSKIPCVPACWIYELERQTDNDNEPDSDLQRLWARDTEDLGAIVVILFHFIAPFSITPLSVTPIIYDALLQRLSFVCDAFVHNALLYNAFLYSAF